MDPYYADDNVLLFKGDCREVLARLDEGCVDTVITDPPYGLEFMGKGWDKGVPGPDFWVEVLRVAKPGAMLLAFGGTRTYHRLACAIEDAGWELRDCLMWLYGTGFPKSHNIGKKVEGWDGWGTALKPAWEPIILAMKPLDGTFANNALEHGVAGLNIDATRIALDGEKTPTGSGKGSENSKFEQVRRSKGNGGNATPSAGRWPANVVLDEEAGEILDEQSGEKKAGKYKKTGKRNSKVGTLRSMNAFDQSVKNAPDNYGDGGGASRFFYCAKAGKKDRGEGNDHPTVKPQSLMRWLVRLTSTPTGGLVLDPFMGSGSTGVACRAEGRQFCGIELDEHYIEIAARRLEGGER